MGWKNAAVAKSAWSNARKKFLNGAAVESAKKGGATTKGKGKKRGTGEVEEDDVEGLVAEKKAKVEREMKGESEEKKVAVKVEDEF